MLPVSKLSKSRKTEVLDDRDRFSDEETEKRRDEVIRRMVNTPPQPKSKIRRPRKTGKKAGAGRAAGKPRASRAR
jgi:hypothetical protein